MNNPMKELWHGNIIPQEDSRTNSKEMKELLGFRRIEIVSNDIVLKNLVNKINSKIVQFFKEIKELCGN